MGISATAPIRDLVQRAYSSHQGRVSAGSGFSGRNQNEVPLVDSAEKRQIQKLQNVDTIVKAHEQTHHAILGAYAQGPIQYTYMRGPDGGLYAVGGSVGVDTSPVPGDPEATIRKARRLRMAAYGPAMPSSQDMRVAAEAYRMETQAKKQLAEAEALSKEEMKQSERQMGLGNFVDILV